MSFGKHAHPKKHLAIGLLLLLFLTAIPIFSAQASVDLLYFRAIAGSNSIKLEWETAQEFDNLGFNLYRGTIDDKDVAQKLNSSLIPGNSGSPTGSYYEWQDNNVQSGIQFYYWLEDIDNSNHPTTHGPVVSSLSGGSGFPTAPAPDNSTATPTPTRTPTRTPTPTTQSSGQPPTQTPTRIPTVTTSAVNPTATSPQVTAVLNNTSATAAPQTQGNATTAAQPANNNGQPTDTPAEAAVATVEPNESEGSPTPQAVVSTNNNQSQSNNGISAQQIGGSAGNSQVQSASSGDGSGPSTAILMALIVSVVLLVIGGGGFAILLINRKKTDEGLSG